MTDAMTLAAHKSQIHDLGVRFDNALDAEDEARFLSVFTTDGSLDGFWGSSTGHAEIVKAFHFMLATFAREKRHVVTNHEVQVDGDRATMFSYLTVFDRKALAVTGTATFTDDLQRMPDGNWLFVRRRLATDPNVQKIIDSLATAG